MTNPNANTRPTTLGLGSALALLALAACSGGSKSTINAVSAGAPGTIVEHPDPASGSLTFVVDANNGGNAADLELLQVLWGRLVDVFDVNDDLQNVDYVVGEDIVSDNVDFSLETNPVTGETRVVILHAADSPAYEAAFRRLDRGLTLVQRKGLAANELPPFSLGPRNAAFVLRFNDLVDPASIRLESVRLFTGNPPATPFTNIRVFADNNHGDLGYFNGQTSYFTTRVIIDPAISSLDLLSSSVPLQINAAGLPPSVTTGQANAVFRLPSRRVLPADRILINLSGKGLNPNLQANQPIESFSQDIVRAFRTGGNTLVTGDPRNGFLLDLDRPQILGSQSVNITAVSGLGDGEFLLDLSFDLVSCALNPRPGDILQQQCRFVQVLEPPSSPPSAGVVTGLRTRLLFPQTAADPCSPTMLAGAAVYRSPWNPLLNFGKQGCFVRFSPAPLLPPLAGGEVQGVLTAAAMTLSFSEPMDPSSLTPFDNFTLTRVRNDPVATDFVVGQVNRLGSLLEFTFQPSLPLAKSAAGANAYFVNLASGGSGPTDLAGNTLLNGLPQVELRLLSSQPDVNTGGIALRFSSADEIPDNANGTEVRGQVLFDFSLGTIRPRPVVRSQAVADRTQPVPSIMNVTPLGVQTPLSGLGSKMQTVWRYFDVGFGLSDESSFNMDIEGIWWGPKNGQVFLEVYDLFEISLAHSRWLPDEDVDNALFPRFPNSGLGSGYEANLLDPQNDPQRIVHPRARGYTVNPNDLRQAPTGTQIVPFPMNRGIPQNQFRYYTWRDTSLQAVAGPAGDGADPAILRTVNGLNPGMVPPTYPANMVPSIGLPILMEFRCYPTSEAVGLNGFDTNFAVASSPRPNFRAYSSGGIDSSGNPFIKNPDLETTASGGFNPNSNGAPTPPADNTFYIGMLNLVSRVSRAHTIWFNTGSTSPVYAQPVLEPRPENQPEGTSVLLAYRGADTIIDSLTAPPRLTTDASCYINPYGNPTNVCTSATIPADPTYHNADQTWKSEIAQVQGAALFQVRMTFIGNTQTTLVPSLSSLGIAYQR